MAKIQIELPDAMAKAAREAGLLTPQALDRLLMDAIRRRQAAGALLEVAELVADAGIAPMPMDEIDAEVTAVRELATLPRAIDGRGYSLSRKTRQ